MMVFFTFFSGIFTRVMFLAHGLVSVYLIVDSKGESKYWWLCTGLFLLLIESFYTIVIRRGKEYKYIWPGSLLYMSTVLPVIWVAELKILNEKIAEGADNCTLDAQKSISVSGVIFKIDSGQLAQKWSKLGLILLIIVGRWLLPRGELTRDQLSTLLLVYVANAADIMELFEVFDKEPSLWCKQGVAIAVLATYTWSFLQFALVFTATAETVPDNKDEKKEPFSEIKRTEEAQKGGTKLPNYIKKLIKQKAEKQKAELDEIEKNTDLRAAVDQMKQLKAYKARGRQARMSIHDAAFEVVQVQREVRREEEILENHIKEKQKLKLHGDLYSILTLMLMQDGPFLIVRLVLIIAYGVNATLHIFFTGKNAMALALLVYRLVILITEYQDDEDEDKDKDFYEF